MSEDDKRLESLRNEMLGCLEVDRQLRKNDKAMETKVMDMLVRNQTRIDEIKKEMEDIILGDSNWRKGRTDSGDMM